MKEAGNFLRTARKNRGISLLKMANRIGISGNYLSQIERGYVPSNEILCLIIDFLEIDIDDTFRMYNKLAPDINNYILGNPQIVKKLRNCLYFSFNS